MLEYNDTNFKKLNKVQNRQVAKLKTFEHAWFNTILQVPWNALRNDQHHHFYSIYLLLIHSNPFNTSMIHRTPCHIQTTVTDVEKSEHYIRSSGNTSELHLGAFRTVLILKFSWFLTQKMSEYYHNSGQDRFLPSSLYSLSSSPSSLYILSYCQFHLINPKIWRDVSAVRTRHLKIQASIP